MDAGSIPASSEALTLSSRYTTLPANLRPVHVLPQARGPSTSTAGIAASALRISSSTTRGKYSQGKSHQSPSPASRLPSLYRKIGRH